MSAGRPKEYTPERIQEIKKLMDEYTDNTPIPIFAEFCYKNNFIRQYLYEIPEISDSIKRLMAKKETVLEKGALSGELNPSMAIFSLKQQGWSDKQEVKHDGDVKITIDYV